MCEQKDPLENINLEKAEPWEVDKALFAGFGSLSREEQDRRIEFSNAFKEYYKEIHFNNTDESDNNSNVEE